MQDRDDWRKYGIPSPPEPTLPDRLGSARTYTFTDPSAQALWHRAFPGELPTPIPPQLNLRDGATAEQIVRAIINDFMLRSQAPFDIHTIEFQRLVSELAENNPAPLLPHYYHIMLNTSPSRIEALTGDPGIGTHWETQQKARARLEAEGALLPPRPLSANELQEQRRTDYVAQYLSKLPPIPRPAQGYEAFLDAERTAAGLQQLLAHDPRYTAGFMDPVTGELAPGEFTQASKVLQDTLSSYISTMRSMSDDVRVNGAGHTETVLQQARLAQIGQNMAIQRARFAADVAMGREKFDYEVMKGERSFIEQVAMDDYMNYIRRQHTEDQYQEAMLQQRRLLNQNNAAASRQAAENFADLMRQNASVLAEHARGIDKNMLQYGDRLIPLDQEFVRNYEPGGIAENIFRRAGLPPGAFKPQRTADLPVYQESLPLSSLNTLLNMSLMAHPAVSGVPQADVPGLPYTFEERPPLESYMSPAVMRSLESRQLVPMEPGLDYNIGEDEEEY